MTFHTHRTPRPAAVPPAARGLPGPMRRAALREALADRVERLLAIMDRLDGDPDLEDGGDADREPSLCGVTVGHPSRMGPVDGEDDAGDNPEEENEHGGDIQDEPHDREEDGDLDSEGEPNFRVPGVRRDPAIDRRSREMVCDARLDLDAVRRRKRLAYRHTGNVRMMTAAEMRVLGL